MNAVLGSLSFRHPYSGSHQHTRKAFCRALLGRWAIESLRALPEAAQFDFAFIDADKQNYASYYEEILQRMPSGGLILCDNVLWGGSVVDPERSDADTNAIRAFNDQVYADERVDTSMISVGDGLLLAHKR